MDVTSLLNSSAARAANGRLPQEQIAEGGVMPMCQTQDRMVPVRSSSDSRVPGRNRTPWDAGGYSLPLTLNVKNTQASPSSKAAFQSETTSMDNAGPSSPKSPRHKFSDSRSSLSSYTTMSSGNSCHSRSHSRISSLSTVSEDQTLSTYGSEATPTDRRISIPESGMACTTVVEIQPPSPLRRSAMEDISTEISENDGTIISDRARSPSDAILMRNRGLTGSVSPCDNKAVGAFLHPDSPSAFTARAHKRTVSAPDFPSLSSITKATGQFQPFGPMAEPTPPKSPTQGDDMNISVSTSNLATAIDQSSQPEAANPTAEPVCMFVTPCTTGSSLRKAISHIFGRNKLCTKAIPQFIWVHYCRKHYQRSRYRNAADYALRQVKLVLLQIDRVQTWSDDNEKVGSRGSGTLKHWTLQARKREAKRLQDSESRKRRFNEEDEDDDQALSSGTAIPDWLQDQLNQDYNTARMLEIVRDIERRMISGEITQIPDIEILPEIITDGNESRPKPTPRRPSHGGHRHTKSEAAFNRNPNMSAYGGRPMGMGFDNKRIRMGSNNFGGMAFHQTALPHRGINGLSINQSYPYMPQNNGFATIAENQADQSYWTGGYNNSVLPQPVQQRQSSVSAPDSNNMQQQYTPQTGRSMHSRSMSETPIMRSGYSNEYRFPAQQTNTYQQQQQQQQQDMFPNMSMAPSNASPAYSYQQPSTHGYGTPFGMARDAQDNPFGNYYQAPTQDWRGQHNRVQSTPAINHQQSTTISGGPPPMPAVNGTQGMLPSMSHQQQMYSAAPQPGYGDFQQSRY